MTVWVGLDCLVTSQRHHFPTRLLPFTSRRHRYLDLTMSGPTPQQTPTMGGLEALVAAANAANQTRPSVNAQNKRKRDVDVDDAMIDPALQVRADAS